MRPGWPALVRPGELGFLCHHKFPRANVLINISKERLGGRSALPIDIGLRKPPGPFETRAKVYSASVSAIEDLFI